MTGCGSWEAAISMRSRSDAAFGYRFPSGAAADFIQDRTMIIKRLQLHNYRRFADADIEFPEQIIGIIGRNGSGKTTMVEAIGWALYGNIVGRTSKADIRSQFARDNDTCSVELEFVYGGEEYRLLRQLKGKNAISEAAIYRAGAAEPEAVMERGVNEYVERLLRLDYRSFFASVFARQRELSVFSSMPGEERRRSISRLINIDRIDKARERVLADRNNQSKMVEGMRRTLVDPAQLQEQINATVLDIARLQARLAEADQAVQACESELQGARLYNEEQSRLRDSWQAHENRISRWHASQIENEAALERSRADLAAITAAGEELARLKSRLDGIDAVRQEKERLDREEVRQARQNGLIQQLHQADAQIAANQNRLNSLKARLEGLTPDEAAERTTREREAALEKEVEAAREAQRHWSGEETAARKRGGEARAKRDQIVQLGRDGQCPTCTQKLADHYEQVLEQMNVELELLRRSWQEASEEAAAAGEKVTEGETALRRLRQEKEELQRRITAGVEAGRARDEAAQELTALEGRRSAIAAELAALGSVLYEATQHARVREQLAELERLQRQADQLAERAGRREQVCAEMARMEQAIADYLALQEQERARQSQLQFEEERYQAARAAVESATSRLLTASKDHADVREQLAGSVRDQERLQAQLAAQHEHRRTIAVAEEEIRYLEALDLHFKKFRVELAGRIRPLIAAHASQLLALTTGGRYSRLELDEEYAITLHDGNHAFPLGRFSGGEQDLANLCLRVAISQILAQRGGGAPINFIVLDEIFGSQDEERKDLIFKALHQLSSQFRQIFMITHVESVKESLPVILEVVHCDEWRSELRLV